MKKLLFTISQLYKGGAETSLVNLLNQLDYSKYEVELLILNQEPVEDAVSLIDRVNSNVKICNAYEEYQKITVWDRVKARYIYTMEQKGAYYITALNFVRNKIYDWAFFIGEWCSPSFVAYEVQAEIKAAWIHSDISKAKYFDAEHYFYFYDMYDYFIFASKNSMKSSIEKFPFIKDKAVVIYNINNVEEIRNKALEPTNEFQKFKRPIVLTCANFRSEKNHLRQVKVMSELKRRGVEFTWFNIGSTNNTALVDKVKVLCLNEGVEERFIISEPKENPYSYMKNADVIAVLSDHESWSMVITEAKILGKPIIATKTSGALEQIEDGISGVLTEFNIQDIANKLEVLITDEKVRENIANNIKNFDNTKKIIDSLENLIRYGEKYKERKVLSEDEKRILYVIDDVNYAGGAHNATKLLLRELINEGKNITVFTAKIPSIKVRKELCGIKFLTWKDFREDVLYNKRLIDCLTNLTTTKEEKKRKIMQFIKQKNTATYYEHDVLPNISKLFSKYDIACVMSEGSSFRKAVADSTCRKKIQWIHTDYVKWRNFSDWTKSITQYDNLIYQKFDKIEVLSNDIKYSFVKTYPELADKVEVFKNILPIDEILKKSNIQTINYPSIDFITVGRLGAEKAFPRLLKILYELKNEGYHFTWNIIGEGEEKNNIEYLINEYELQKYVKLLGFQKNPYPYIKKAQVFALLSSYEGLPNTIYEALILGVPVLATDVGGISEQIEDGVTGWLVDNTENAIKNKLKDLFAHNNIIDKTKPNIKNYNYDNKIVLKNINKLLE